MGAAPCRPGSGIPPTAAVIAPANRRNVPVARTPNAMTRLDDADRANRLVDTVSLLMAKLNRLETMPLDTLDRYERLLVESHTANLLRLPYYFGAEDAAAQQADRERPAKRLRRRRAA